MKTLTTNQKVYDKSGEEIKDRLVKSNLSFMFICREYLKSIDTEFGVKTTHFVENKRLKRYITRQVLNNKNNTTNYYNDYNDSVFRKWYEYQLKSGKSPDMVVEECIGIIGNCVDHIIKNNCINYDKINNLSVEELKHLNEVLS